MARKPQHEQGDTLLAIKTAAFPLFGRYGYDGVSMGAIAKKARITKAAIYWHFADKKALYVCCMEHLFEIFAQQTSEPILQVESPCQKVLALFEGTLHWLCDVRVRSGVAGYWLEGSGEQLEEARAIQGRFQEEAKGQLAGILGQGMKAGELRATVAPEDLADGIVTLILAGVMPLRDQTLAQTRTLMRTLAHTFFMAYALDLTYATLALGLGGEG